MSSEAKLPDTPNWTESENFTASPQSSVMSPRPASFGRTVPPLSKNEEAVSSAADGPMVASSWLVNLLISSKSSFRFVFFFWLPAVLSGAPHRGLLIDKSFSANFDCASAAHLNFTANSERSGGGCGRQVCSGVLQPSRERGVHEPCLELPGLEEHRRIPDRGLATVAAPFGGVGGTLDAAFGGVGGTPAAAAAALAALPRHPSAVSGATLDAALEEAGVGADLELVTVDDPDVGRGGGVAAALGPAASTPAALGGGERCADPAAGAGLDPRAAEAAREPGPREPGRGREPPGPTLSVIAEVAADPVGRWPGPAFAGAGDCSRADCGLLFASAGGPTAGDCCRLTAACGFRLRSAEPPLGGLCF